MTNIDRETGNPRGHRQQPPARPSRQPSLAGAQDRLEECCHYHRWRRLLWPLHKKAAQIMSHHLYSQKGFKCYCCCSSCCCCCCCCLVVQPHCERWLPFVRAAWLGWCDWFRCPSPWRWPGIGSLWYGSRDYFFLVSFVGFLLFFFFSLTRAKQPYSVSSTFQRPILGNRWLSIFDLLQTFCLCYLLSLSLLHVVS